MLVEITEGWTGVLGPFTLRVDGTPLNLSGFTVALKLRNALGVAVTPGGTVTVNPDQTSFPGQVSYAPHANDFAFVTGVLGPISAYHFHWQVTDGNSRVIYFPSGAPDVIGVYRA